MIFAFGVILILGLFFSPALISIGTIGLSICGIFKIFTNPNYQTSYQKIDNYLSICFVFLFFLSLMTYFWQIDLKSYLERMTVKLPYLLFPFIFISIKALTKKYIQILCFIYVLSASLTGLISFVNYAIHFEAINESIIHSKPIPILFDKISHIYFGIMLSFSTLISLFYILESKKKNFFYFIILGLQVIFIHTIISRTGVLGFYAAFLLTTIYYFWKKRSFKYLVVTFGLIVVSISFSLMFVPSWKLRVLNTKEDLSTIGTGVKMNNFSLSMRYEAINISLLVFKENFIKGVGEGSLKIKMAEKYKSSHSIISEENQKLPHNQILQNLCTTGFLGGLFLIGIFILLIIKSLKMNSYYLLSFSILMFFALQFESVLERQIGIGFFILMISIFFTKPQFLSMEV